MPRTTPLNDPTISVPHRVQAWAATHGIPLSLKNIQHCSGREWAISANTDQMYRLVEASGGRRSPLRERHAYKSAQEWRLEAIRTGKMKRETAWFDIYEQFFPQEAKK